MAYPNRKLPPLTEQVVRRFWKHVAITQPSDCWLWTGHVQKRGYGVFIINKLAWRVHRVAYAIHFGVEPDQMLVCHHCDVRNCCNPAHLFMGTTQDNTRDMKEKGRAASGDQSPARIHIETRPRGDGHYARKRPDQLARGDSHWMKQHPESITRGEHVGTSKLTSEQVREIRQIAATRGYRYDRDGLARRFGVHRGTIKAIVLRKSWKHI